MKSNKNSLQGRFCHDNRYECKIIVGCTIFKCFTVGKKLGTGAFGQIYMVINNNKENDKYAVKAQPISTRHPQLQFQAKLYKYLSVQGEIIGFPKVYSISTQYGYNLMMMDLLGKSLQDIFVIHKKKFTIKTVLMIGIQLLQRIKYLHEHKFLHRDIKPDNLLMGINEKIHIIYLVDMGLAKKYISDSMNYSYIDKHISYKQGKQLTGTARYASISTHKGYQQSRRDDIQSISYVLMYFFRGILPWQNMKAKDTRQKYKMIMNKKINTSINQLCQGYPKEMKEFIQSARQLKFQETPNYKYFQELLLNAMKRLSYSMDYQFDWTI